MKRTVLVILLLTAGLGIIAFPFIGNYLNQKNSTQVIENYQRKKAELSPEQMEELFQQAQIYNENLLGQPAHDPFIPGSGIVMPENYYHGTKDNILRKAVGHLEGSALPIGGEGTHTVLTSHTGLTHAKLFTDLTELSKGDPFYIHVLDRTLAYEVDKISVIEPDHTEPLKVVKGEDYATLLTCTPYGVNSHRLLVRGKRVSYQPKKKVQKKKMTTENQLLFKTVLVTSSFMLVLILLNYWRNKQKAG
jgi:sortase A